MWWGHKGHPGVQTPRVSLYNMYLLLIIDFFMLQASDLAPLSSVYPHR